MREGIDVRRDDRDPSGPRDPAGAGDAGARTERWRYAHRATHRLGAGGGRV